MHAFRAAFKLWHEEYIPVLWPGTFCHDFYTNEYYFHSFIPIWSLLQQEPNVEPVLPINNNSFGVNSIICLFH